MPFVSPPTAIERGHTMIGIEKILAHIQSESNAECKAIEDSAAQECGRIRAEAEKTEQEEYRGLIDTGTKDAELRVERLNSLAVLESKKQVLATQQEMVAEAFKHAAQKLLELPESEYISFLAAQACNASLKGDETIFLSPSDHQRFGNKVLDASNSALRAAGKAASLTLSEKTADISGGLILSGGDIEVNCSIDALVAEHKNDLSPKVASVLFD